MSQDSRLGAAVTRIARNLPGKIGIYLRRLDQDTGVEVRADDVFPLASVFKLGVLVELFRRVDAGDIHLTDRWTVREGLQSLESGVLMYLDAGLRPTVRDLAELMMIVSDNTATDMIFKRLGVRRVNPALRALGLRSTDIYFPNREWFLLCLGFDPHFRGLEPEALAWRWEAMEPARRYDEVDWLIRHGQRVSLKAMRRRAQAILRAGTEETRAWRHLEQSTDNRGSPQDIGQLLEAIVRGHAASRRSCRTIVSILRDQQYHRLAEGLPRWADIASKTGSIAGVVNDAGIVFPPGKPPFLAVCLTEDLTPRQERQAPQVIARVARAAWQAWA